jgi:nucleotide-binding universal stress UspA family protein
MYQSILVPLDGSTFAEQALPVAWSIARRAGATLQLVRIHVPFPAKGTDNAIRPPEELNIQSREQERVYLDKIASHLKLNADFPVTTALLDGKAGQIAESLNNYAKTKDVDLVVIATHGHGALTRFWLGSVADKLIRQVEKPILLVRPQDTTSNLTHEQVFRHILIPLDGSIFAEQVLEYAVALGKLMQADYTLLRVIELMIPGNYPSEQWTGIEKQWLDQRQAEAQIYLEGVAERLHAQSLQVQTKIVINYQPAVAILEEASKSGIDLIAMETQGHGNLARLFLGSVVDKVLRGASIPVLLHRPRSEPS